MGRRTNGTGSIRQRKNALWEARLPAPYNKSLYGKTKMKVCKKLKEFMDKVQKEGYADVERITLDEYLERFIRDVKANDMKSKASTRLSLLPKTLFIPI